MFEYLQLDKVWANARYEMMILRRGWFFRIFAGLSLAIFVLLNVLFFSKAASYVPRIFYGLSASSPYFNMLMFNLAQIVVVALLTSDLFKRDKRINTTDVYYIRSMTNASYIFGKIIGILIIFGILNLSILVIAAIIQYVFGNTNFNILTYLWYFILIPLPAFVFVAGLSFILIRIVKNQAIVVLLVLGYFAAVMIYLRDQWFYIFDFTVLNFPLIYSDFYGLPNLNAVLLHRSLYLILGIVFILLAVLFFTRLSQSEMIKRLMAGLIILLSISSIVIAYQYMQIYLDRDALRERMIALNNQYKKQSNVTIDKYRINLIHENRELKVSTHLLISNRNSKTLNKAFFALNPDLTVISTSMAEQDLDYIQNDHLVEVLFKEPFPPNREDTIHIEYQGGIDDAVCYLDISDEKYLSGYNIWAYQIAKKYAILEPDYVLLTPECLWYPGTNLPLQVGELISNQRPFSEFELSVKTHKDLLPISQGVSDTTNPKGTVYSPEQPLPGMSLIIGNYERRSIRIDSIDYSLYIHPEHTYFDQYFENVGDTLESILKEALETYEVKLDLEYPFKRISLVEVPIPFFSYSRLRTVARDVIQPEQIWLPENAAFLRSADFSLMDRFMERRLDRSNQTLTNAESEASIFKQFIHSTFLGEMSFGGRMGGPDIAYQPDFNLFPNFYSYSNYLFSQNWPILNTALEAFLYNRVQNSDSDPRASLFSEGLTETEEVSQQLTRKSLAELLSSNEENTFLSAIVRAKGSYLFKILQRELNIAEFDHKINTAVESQRFKIMTDRDLVTGRENISTSLLDSLMKDWYYAKQLPGFLVSGVRMFKVVDKNRMRYQIFFHVTNTEDVLGLVEVQFQFGSFGRRSMGVASTTEEEPTRLYEIKAGESKEIGIVLDSEPRSININFQIAWNIPILYSKQFEKAELEDRYSPFDGERILEYKDNLQSSNEIIIDNEDKGFIVHNPQFQSIIKKMIHGVETKQEDTFQRFTWWSPAAQWSLVKNASFYGKYIHSAYYVRSGDGSRFVYWKADLPDDGLYDVYTYMFDKRTFWRGRRGRSRGNATFGDFSYIIHHDGGKDQVSLDSQNASDGWHFLGTYYFSKGEAKVELTNQSNGRLVVADAIKLVPN